MPHTSAQGELLKLLEFNFWANDRIIGNLKNHRLDEPLARQMSDILNAHRIWLKRIADRGSLASVWEKVTQENWEGINIELYNETSDILKSRQPSHMISYQDSEKLNYNQRLSDIIFHLVNQSTHHRAQLLTQMRDYRILPPTIDYISFCRESD